MHFKGWTGVENILCFSVNVIAQDIKRKVTNMLHVGKQIQRFKCFVFVLSEYYVS